MNLHLASEGGLKFRLLKRPSLLVFAFLATLIGCATQYQKETVFLNGYSEYRAAEDRFVITYRANEFTKPDQVMRYALRRSAEVSLKHGYRYFVVIEQMQSGKHLNYPSLRLLIRCYHQPPSDCPSIDATNLSSLP